ncbi:MAG: hypothetical protein ACC660_01895 [Acidimicrobiales bacterium]
MQKLVPLLVTLAIVAVACGGGNDDVTVDISDDPLAQAIAADIMDDSEGDSPIGTQEQAECFAGGIVQNVGAGRLNELGVTVEDTGDIQDYDFSDSELDTIVDSLTACVELETLLAEQFSEDFGEEGGLCLAKGLGEDVLKDLMKDGFAGDADSEPSAEFFQVFLDIAAECNLPLGG